MRAFLITFKPDSENSERGWPISELHRLMHACRARGEAIEDWRFQSFRQVQIHDRVFLLQQGKQGPAIIGYGECASPPKKNLNRNMIAVRFEQIVDPTSGGLVSREELLNILDGKRIWRTQASGVPIPGSIASNA